jgi:hypothetical protein
MSKLTLNEISYLIAEGQSLEEIAQHSGWSVESLRHVKKTRIYESEINYDGVEESVDKLIEERLEGEQMLVQDERRFTDADQDWYYAGLYEREEGDPEELDFNDY